MKPLSTLITLVFVGMIQALYAQESGWRAFPNPQNAESSAAVDADKLLQAHMDDSRQRLQDSLKNYLVAFDASADGEHKRVGLALGALSTRRMRVAYDPGARGLMAQWQVSDSSFAGKKLNYHAYIGESGSVQFVIRARY